MRFDGPEPALEAAIDRFMATQSVLQSMLHMVVDTLDCPMSVAQRQKLFNHVNRVGYVAIFEGKLRAALRRWLTPEEVDALRYVASAPNEARPGLFKVFFALNWARADVQDYVVAAREQLFPELGEGASGTDAPSGQRR